mmetsp:Transcript_4439/g.14157  ORF Transcript_4439/g.14157 Transcript_4439/m.14157 type:complete len:283 (-) Transcript_4439:88-936(-)
MPGRHGAMRHGRNRSKRQRPDEMETTLKDSIHNSRRKEQAILRDLVPPRLQGVKKTVVPTRRLATPVSTRLGGKATGAEGEVEAVQARADVDAGSVLQKLAALRQSVAANSNAPAVDWAAKREEAPPAPKVDPRRAKVLARRKAVAERDAAARAAAEARKAARRAAAAAEAGSDEEGSEAGSDDDNGAAASPMDKVKKLAEKLPAVGKKAAAQAAFKVLKAKVQAEKEERALKKAARKAKAKAKAAAGPEAEDSKKAGKKKGKKKGGAKKKSGSKGWAPVRA